MTTAQKFPEWQHLYQSKKPYKGGDNYKPGTVIRVRAGLHYIDGNTRPYFSVTGEIQEPRMHDVSAAGCITREILAHWPELAPVVALHLSDDTGAPMHAVENGWYQLAGYFGGAGERYHAGNGKRQHWNPDGSFNGYREPTEEECLQSWAEHVRLSLEEAREVARYVDDCPDAADAKGRHALWISRQAARWQDEADAAIALLDSLREGK